MRAARPFQHGLSLVELMISVAISAAVLSSLVYVYVGSRAVYRNNEALARVQETGRFALEWISRDLRQAGYMGCLSRGASVTYISNPRPTILPGVDQPPAIGVYGYEDGEGFVSPGTIARVRGDVLLVASLDGRTLTPIAADIPGNSTTASIVDNCAQFAVNDVVVVSDCGRAVVVTVTARANSRCGAGSGATVLTFGAGSNDNPDSPGSAGLPPFRAADRTFVARLASGSAATPSVGYFIGNNRAGRPSLYRFAGASAAEEVAENVEDFDVLYGVDTNGDGAVDVYQTAADVTAASQWSSVLSVRVSVIAVGSEPVDRPGADRQVLYFRDTDGDTVVDAQAAPADRRLRQVFTTTVALRNRLD
jgi:type IV pilus assembly protein PilW